MGAITTVRPRRGDLEAATKPHAFVPSGEHVGHAGQVEVCDLCGLTQRGGPLHPERHVEEDGEDFGPDLIIRPGDEEFVGLCGRCDKHLGTIRPNGSMDLLLTAWERHAFVPPRCPGRA